MRNFLDGGRNQRRQRESRFRSRYARGRISGKGGQKLIRYRRNRELMASELVRVGLWTAIAIMLVSLTRVLWRVVQVHLAESGPLVQLGLPAISLLAFVGCVWRGRKSLREFLDIRREQQQLEHELRDDPEAERLEV